MLQKRVLSYIRRKATYYFENVFNLEILAQNKLKNFFFVAHCLQILVLDNF